MPITKTENRSAVVRVILVEGLNIPRTRNKQPNVNCLLQLGKQREESTATNEHKHPIWRNEFEFYIYEDSREELQVTVKTQHPKSLKDGFNSNEDIGRVNIDLSSLKPEMTQDIWEDITREDSNGAKYGKLHFVITISGITSADSPSNSACNASWEMLKITMADKANPSHFSSNKGHVGRLLIKVHYAEGLRASKYLAEKPNPFCSVKLGTDVLRTQTLYKTITPSWNKCFELAVRDISDYVECTVFDEEGDKKYRILGVLKVPLLHICNEEKNWYSLKDVTLRTQAKGDEPKVQLEFLLVYDTKQAALATFKPRQAEYITKNVEREQFDRKVFGHNLKRLRVLREHSGLQEMKSEINSILNWENKLKSIFALIFYVAVVYFFQPWMLFCVVLIVFLTNSKRTSSNKTFDENKSTLNTEDDLDYESSSDEMDESEVSKEEDVKERVNIRTKINRIQKVALKVQQLLGGGAHWGECVKNLVEFKVPFLSWIVVILLAVLTVVLYFIPLRYLVMVGGVNKILKRLIRPSSESSVKKLMHFMSKVPDSEALKDWDTLPKATLEERPSSVETFPKEGKIKRFSKDIFNKKRKTMPSSSVGAMGSTAVDEELDSDIESENGNEHYADNNESLGNEAECLEGDEVDGAIKRPSDELEQNGDVASYKLQAMSNNNISSKGEPEIQMSKVYSNFSSNTENRRAKEISIFTKEISNEISRKSGVIRDKIVATSTLLSKMKEDSIDSINNISDPENASEHTPRIRKRDILMAKIKEKTNPKDPKNSSKEDVGKND